MGDFPRETSAPQATVDPETPTKNLREYVMTQVRGSRVRLPDFQSLLAHWPQGVHPEVDRLEQDVQRILESIFPNPEDVVRLQRTKAAKLGLFSASWWAYSSYDALKTLLHLSIWASDFRRETLAYLNESLSDGGKRDCSAISTNPIITGFGPVGQSIASWGDDGVDQVNMFLRELAFFIQMVEEEQKAQAMPHLPTVDEYMKHRMGTSGVRTFLAIMESNDILSLKKEIAQSQVDSLIPLLFLELGSTQAAIDRGADMVKASIGRFEAAEEGLLARYSNSPDSGRVLKDYIDGCKYACTANVNWRQVHSPCVQCR
ncbi:terpenoid synthase [Apiospora sp. TS-2023a]